MSILYKEYTICITMCLYYSGHFYIEVSRMFVPHNSVIDILFTTTYFALFPVLRPHLPCALLQRLDEEGDGSPLVSVGRHQD